MQLPKGWEVKNLEDKLIEILNTFGYPVIRQGSLTDNDEYPDTFFTYWNNYETETKAYDNVTASVLYDYDVNVYSTDPNKVYNLLIAARELLKTNGFNTPSRGYDVGSDEPTHTGRGMNVQFNTLTRGDNKTIADLTTGMSKALDEIINTQNKYL